VEPDAEIFEIADHKQSSLDVILQREERQGLEHALAELTPAERELIVRLYIDDESPKQIRGNMQLTEARFYSLKTRGRKKLLAMLRKPVQRSGHAHIVSQERLAG
jgi:RNA polymerase sigma factor (sigma-70 family)